jgi:hypothetical protein
MKRLALAFCACIAMPAQAIWLYADPYPATALQPDAAAVTVNGGAPIACTLEAIPAGLRPACDLSALPLGVATLVLTVSVQAKCINSAGGAVCNAAGSASSGPFRYESKAGSATAPVLRAAP